MKINMALSSSLTIYLVIQTFIVLFGFFVASLESPLWKGIGASMVATGVTGWVIFFYLRFVDKEIENRKALAKLGLVTGFSHRSTPLREMYKKRFEASRNQIDFCGYGLRALREDFLEDFPSWFSHAKVRILLVDPEAPSASFSFADQRDREERNANGSISSDVAMFLQSALPLKNAYSCRFDVRLYRCIPAVNICRIDDELFWGPYIVGEQSRNTPTFEVAEGGLLFDVLSKHYEKIWLEMSRPAFELSDSGKFVLAISNREEKLEILNG